MTIPSNVVMQAAILGIGATVLMDFWNLLLRRAFGIPSLDYGLLGRWVRHMTAGTFRHPDISLAAPKSFERSVGWTAHYTVGAVLGVGFIAMVHEEWLVAPTVLPAVLFGVGTVVFPLFILQPALGLGVASSRTSRPMFARAKSLATHLVLGTGLYAVAVVLALARVGR